MRIYFSPSRMACVRLWKPTRDDSFIHSSCSTRPSLFKWFPLNNCFAEVPWWVISNERWLISTFNIWMTMRPVIISLKSCSVLYYYIIHMLRRFPHTDTLVNYDSWLEQENWCTRIISAYMCFRRRCAQLTAFFSLLHLMRFECTRSTIPYFYMQ